MKKILTLVVLLLFFSNIAFGFEVGGRYYWDSEKIEIYGSKLDRFYIFDVAFHEIGHHYWNTEINQLNKRKYSQIYKNADNYVSLYAKPKGLNEKGKSRGFKDDMREDFAETFSIAIDCTFNLSRVPEDRRTYYMSNVAYRLPCEVVR